MSDPGFVADIMASDGNDEAKSLLRRLGLAEPARKLATVAYSPDGRAHVHEEVENCPVYGGPLYTVCPVGAQVYRRTQGGTLYRFTVVSAVLGGTRWKKEEVTE